MWDDKEYFSRVTGNGDTYKVGNAGGGACLGRRCEAAHLL